MTDGHILPKPDTKQESDWNVTNLTEMNGWTVMEFTRKQNTSDIDDHVIGVSTLHCNGKTSQLIVQNVEDLINVNQNVHAFKITVFTNVLP